MVFTVRLSGKKSSQSDINLEFDIKLNDYLDSFLVLERFQDMWSDICHTRDQNFRRRVVNITGITTKDEDAFKGTIISLNAELLFMRIINLANVWLPEDVGRRWIRYMFQAGPICIDQVAMSMHRGEDSLSSFLPKHLGVFSVESHLLDSEKDGQLPRALNVPTEYRINSYKELCEKVYSEAQAGKYPLTFFNPTIELALMPQPSLGTRKMLKTISDYIICDAITKKGNVNEKGAKDIWRLCKLIREDKVSDAQLLGLSVNAYSLITGASVK